MRTEDGEPFFDLMQSVARSMRAKFSREDATAYFDGLADVAFATVRERVLEWRNTKHFFPTVAQLRSSAETESAEGGERFSPEWWRGVKRTEAEIMRRDVARPVKLRHASDVDPQLRMLESEVATLARGVSLYDGTPEGAEWDRRYQAAAMRLAELTLEQFRNAAPPPPMTTQQTPSAFEPASSAACTIGADYDDEAAPMSEPDEPEHEQPQERYRW